MSLKISIIMNCYNGATFLKRSIESVISQTYDNWEIIFYDNNSDDESVRIAKSFNEKKIKIIQSKQHTTLVKARKLALRYTTGDWISFLDVDDYWSKNRLTKFIEKTKKNEIGFIYSNTYFFNEKFKKKIYSKKMPEGSILQSLIPNYFISLEAIMIRKDLLNKITLDENLHFTYDLDIVAKITSITHSAYIETPLSYWRMHSKSSTQKYRLKFTYERWYWINSKFAQLNFSISKRVIFKLRLVLEYLYFGSKLSAYFK